MPGLATQRSAEQIVSIANPFSKGFILSSREFDL